MKRKRVAGPAKPAKKRVKKSNVPANLRSFGTETKALDNPEAVVAINATGSVTTLNLIRAGNSFFNRIGRRIELKNLTLSLQILPKATSTTPEYARVIVVYDRQTNGAAPAVADILQTVDQAGANTTTSFSGINLNNRDRFRIFVDERIVLPTQSFAAGVITNPGFVDPVKTTFNIKRFVKLRGEVTQYKADSAPAVVGDIATGGLFLLLLSTAAAGAEGWQTLVETRIRYNDI